MDDTATADTAAPRDTSPEDRRRVLWAGFIGTLIEWFDYYLYGAAAAVGSAGCSSPTWTR